MASPATGSHRGQIELGDHRLGATLILESDKILLELTGPGAGFAFPERLDLVRFTSNTGYFTLLALFRMNMNIRLGVGSLATYSVRLAFESGYFEVEDDIRSTCWSIEIRDLAKVFHVNGVQQRLVLPEQGNMIVHWTIAPPASVPLPCPDSGLTITLGQNIRTGGNAIDGPTIALSYPATIRFPNPVDPDDALTAMRRIQFFFSMLMGRVLPIDAASVRFDLDDGPHEMPMHGLLPTENSEKPSDCLLGNLGSDRLALLLDRWLFRYSELADAIRLHMSALEQRRLPTELRFQIFVQALEALHRRTSSPSSAPIDSSAVLASLRDHGIRDDIRDRVAGILAHAHEPGLRQRLGSYWDAMAPELEALRPGERRRQFIGRVVATRNHYAHRLDPDAQVLQGPDLWDATELIKAISHMALLLEMGADITGIGESMLDRRFAEFTLRD